MRMFLTSVFATSILSGCGLIAGYDAGEPFDDSVILGVNYVGLSTPSLDATETYYKTALATQTVDDQALDIDGSIGSLAPFLDDNKVEARLIRSSNSQIRLMSFPQTDASRAAKAVPVNGPGIAHVCFQVAKSTSAYARVIEAGATPIGAPDLVHLNKKKPVYYGYVKDPHGVITEIEEVDVAALELPEPPKNAYRMRHVSLATPDIDAMITFYSALLGEQSPRRAGTRFPIGSEKTDGVSGLKGSKVEMAWYQISNLELEIFQYHSHPTGRPTKPRPINATGYNMIMLDVSNLDAARERIAASGGEIVAETNSLDGGTVLFTRDPDHNLLGLQVLPNGSVFSAKNFPDNGL
ncbi:MAG: VOC family protein [Alphaproteobacteria bacterium]